MKIFVKYQKTFLYNICIFNHGMFCLFISNVHKFRVQISTASIKSSSNALLLHGTLQIYLTALCYDTKSGKRKFFLYNYTIHVSPHKYAIL
jgi:hypothetical protein